MRHRSSKELFTYWNSIRGNRLAPRRLEIEPGCIGSLLPNTFILERQIREFFSFRLAGSRVSQLFGKELQGQNFLYGWSERDCKTLQSRLHSIAIQGGGALFQVEMENILAESLLLEMLILPLLHLEVFADRYLGCMSTFEQPRWLGQEPLIKKEILSDLIIFPQAYYPNSLPSPVETQISKFQENSIRKSRLVVKNNRQFRVYDGGRLDPKPHHFLKPL